MLNLVFVLPCPIVKSDPDRCGSESSQKVVQRIRIRNTVKNCSFIKGNPPESGQVIREVEKVEEGGGDSKPVPMHFHRVLF